jgi:D-3-phosphoglycerate dehydrogenase / 2-oxoglutarate reductase
MAEGTVLFDGSPRVLAIDGISLESQLGGTILYLRNHDEPEVIGQVGNTLGRLGVNVATFASAGEKLLGEQVSLVRVDGPVQDTILSEILQIKAFTEAKLLRFAE